MRYYDIRFTDPDGNLLKKFGFARFGYDTNYTTHIENRFLTGALNIEFNIPQGPYATPQQGSWLRIWGVPLEELANSKILGPDDSKLCGITIRAGMKKGLPLANPAYAGVIADGSIFRPFGNWEGTNQTLEMVLLPAVGSLNGQTVSLTFNCAANASVADAIKQALSTLSNYTSEVFISDEIKFNYPILNAPYTTLNQFAAAMLKLSLQQQFQGIKPLGGGKYGGIQFRIIGKKITVYDGTKDYGANTYANPKVIELERFIGQPTWNGPNSINFKLVMCADINVGDYVQLPTTLAIPYVLSTPGASVPGAPSRNSLTFKGRFVIINVRHIGNSRNPSADAWTTSFNATYLNEPSALIAKTGT